MLIRQKFLSWGLDSFLPVYIYNIACFLLKDIIWSVVEELMVAFFLLTKCLAKQTDFHCAVLLEYKPTYFS